MAGSSTDRRASVAGPVEAYAQVPAVDVEDNDALVRALAGLAAELEASSFGVGGSRQAEEARPRKRARTRRGEAREVGQA